MLGSKNLKASHQLTLRAQLTRSSSLVMTYSPLLLATAAGLAAATAVLFSLTGTTLQQKDEEEVASPCAKGLLDIFSPL